MAHAHSIQSAAFLRKAVENLVDAQAALGAGRRNACARSSYYAAFHAAVAALWAQGIKPGDATDGTLSHKMVRAEWEGRLVYRRKLYPPELRGILGDLVNLRVKADYRTETITSREARRAVSASERLVRHVEAKLGPLTDRGD